MKTNAPFPKRKLNRLSGYDYAEDGYYFVTVCTKDRAHWFGEVRNGEMILNQYGMVVQSCWNEMPAHFDHVRSDGFVIMPNHVHGIVVVGNQSPNVGNRHACSLQPKERQYQTIPVIIGAFKSAVTRRINEKLMNGKCFQWQKSYYDHIIHNEMELNGVRQYILDNLVKWEEDSEYSP